MGRLHLFEQLQTCSFNRSWLNTIEHPHLYRRVGPNRDVLDTAGSLSDGGRHNIGGAQSSTQVTNTFSPIGSKRSALYLGEDPLVVRKEYGDEGVPGSKAITYSIKLRRRKHLILIDAHRAITDLIKSVPDISEIVGTASMNGKWVDLKQPAPSQIFGHWLMHNASKNADGIRFPTAHGGGGWNVCLFFADSKACKKMLRSTPIL
jgi:hypothetical protein